MRTLPCVRVLPGSCHQADRCSSVFTSDQDSVPLQEILRNILGYKPSVGAAVAAIAFYLVSTLLLHISFFRTFRGHKLMIVLLLGMIGEVP